MDARAEQVLIAIIDDALNRTGGPDHLTTTRAVSDLLLDLRLAVVEISTLDRLLVRADTGGRHDEKLVT